MSISHSIRRWAATHFRIAQGLIALFTITLFFLSHFIGVLAEQLGVNMYAMFIIGTGIAILAWTMAPRKGEKFLFRYSYKRQIIAVGLMLISTCIGLGGAAICLDRIDLQNTTTVISQQREAALGPSIFTETKTTNRINKAVSTWFRGGISKRVSKKMKRLTKFKNRKPLSQGEVSILTFFSFILAVALVYGILILSCSIACSGYSGLAILTLIGGIGLIIFLLARVLKRIRKENPKQKKSRVVPGI